MILETGTYKFISVDGEHFQGSGTIDEIWFRAGSSWVRILDNANSDDQYTVFGNTLIRSAVYEDADVTYTFTDRLGSGFYILEESGIQIELVDNSLETGNGTYVGNDSAPETLELGTYKFTFGNDGIVTELWYRDGSAWTAIELTTNERFEVSADNQITRYIDFDEVQTSEVFSDRLGSGFYQKSELILETSDETSPETNVEDELPVETATDSGESVADSADTGNSGSGIDSKSGDLAAAEVPAELIGGTGSKAGDIVLEGTDALDTAIYQGYAFADVELMQSGEHDDLASETWTAEYEYNGIPGSLETLVDVERIEFDDVNAALDLDLEDSAGAVRAITQVAFGQEVDADTAGLWINFSDELFYDAEGLAQVNADNLNDHYDAIAAEMIEYYTNGAGVSDVALATLLANNLFDQTDAAAIAQYGINLLEGEQMTQVELVTFAAMHEVNTSQYADGLSAFVYNAESLLG